MGGVFYGINLNSEKKNTYHFYQIEMKIQNFLSQLNH